MVMHITYTVSLAIQTTALAHSFHGNLQMPLTPTKLLRPRYTPTHTHTHTLGSYSHLLTNTSTLAQSFLSISITLALMPSSSFFIFLFFSFHLPACLCICPYVLLDDSLSLRRHAHRPPTACSLWVWCIQHTKLERTFTIWQGLIWLADYMQNPGVKSQGFLTVYLETKLCLGTG